MADKRRGVFCVAVIVSVLGLGNGEGATFNNFTALKQEWVDCGYPPPETYNESLSTYSFSKCLDNQAGAGVKEICGLYQQEVDRLCHTSGPTELKQTASETKEMLNAKLHVCGLAKRVQLSPKIQEHLQGSRCAPACSSLGAPEVCQLLIFLCITGPDSFFVTPTYDPTTAPPSTVQTTTSTAAATTTTAAPTVTTKSIPNEPTADPTATATAPPTATRTAPPTATTTAPPTATTTAPPTATTTPAQDALQTTKGSDTEVETTAGAGYGSEVETTTSTGSDHGQIKEEPDFTSSGHFMAFFIPACVLAIAAYVVYNNRKKIIAVIVEGRSSRRKRSNDRGKYKILQNDAEEVLSSTSATNFIY